MFSFFQLRNELMDCQINVTFDFNWHIFTAVNLYYLVIKDKENSRVETCKVFWENTIKSLYLQQLA